MHSYTDSHTPTTSRHLFHMSTSKYCVLCLHLHRNRWIHSPNAFQAVKEFWNIFRPSPFSLSYFCSHTYARKSKNILRNVLKMFVFTFSCQVFWYNTRHQTEATILRLSHIGFGFSIASFTHTHTILKRIQMQKVKRLGIEKREAENSENFIKIRIIWPHGC